MSIKLALVLLTMASSLLFAKDIAVTDLPKPVVTSIQKSYPDSKMIRAEEEHEGGKLHYEVKVELKNLSRLKLELLPDGTVFKSKATD